MSPEYKKLNFIIIIYINIIKANSIIMVIIYNINNILLLITIIIELSFIIFIYMVNINLIIS